MQSKYLIAYSEKILRFLSTVTSYHLFGVQTQTSAIESLGLEYQLFMEVLVFPKCCISWHSQNTGALF